MKEHINSSSCHCINLRRAANAVTDYYDRRMAALGITVNQYSLLANIQKLQPCSVAELARHVRLERTTLVRNLKTLYTMGWVEDDAIPGNRKNKNHLTVQGENMVIKAKLCWKQAQEDIEACLGEEKLRILTDSLLLLEKLNMEEKT